VMRVDTDGDGSIRDPEAVADDQLYDSDDLEYLVKLNHTADTVDITASGNARNVEVIGLLTATNTASGDGSTFIREMDFTATGELVALNITSDNDTELIAVNRDNPSDSQVIVHELISTVAGTVFMYGDDAQQGTGTNVFDQYGGLQGLGADILGRFYAIQNGPSDTDTSQSIIPNIINSSVDVNQDATADYGIQTGTFGTDITNYTDMTVTPLVNADGYYRVFAVGDSGSGFQSIYEIFDAQRAGTTGTVSASIGIAAINNSVDTDDNNTIGEDVGGRLTHITGLENDPNGNLVFTAFNIDVPVITGNLHISNSGLIEDSKNAIPGNAVAVAMSNVASPFTNNAGVYQDASVNVYRSLVLSDDGNLYYVDMDDEMAIRDIWHVTDNGTDLHQAGGSTSIVLNTLATDDDDALITGINAMDMNLAGGATFTNGSLYFVGNDGSVNDSMRLYKIDNAGGSATFTAVDDEIGAIVNTLVADVIADATTDLSALNYNAGIGLTGTLSVNGIDVTTGAQTLQHVFDNIAAIAGETFSGAIDDTGQITIANSAGVVNLTGDWAGLGVVAGNGTASATIAAVDAKPVITDEIRALAFGAAANGQADELFIVYTDTVTDPDNPVEYLARLNNQGQIVERTAIDPYFQIDQNNATATDAVTTNIVALALNANGDMLALDDRGDGDDNMLRIDVDFTGGTAGEIQAWSDHAERQSVDGVNDLASSNSAIYNGVTDNRFFGAGTASTTLMVSGDELFTANVTNPTLIAGVTDGTVTANMLQANIIDAVVYGDDSIAMTGESNGISMSPVTGDLFILVNEGDYITNHTLIGTDVLVNSERLIQLSRTNNILVGDGAADRGILDIDPLANDDNIGTNTIGIEFLNTGVLVAHVSQMGDGSLPGNSRFYNQLVEINTEDATVSYARGTGTSRRNDVDSSLTGLAADPAGNLYSYSTQAGGNNDEIWIGTPSVLYVSSSQQSIFDFNVTSSTTTDADFDTITVPDEAFLQDTADDLQNPIEDIFSGLAVDANGVIYATLTDISTSNNVNRLVTVGTPGNADAGIF
ncbi:MAG TPA: hypothetical protein DCM28_21860, partial [Phycisphaerales bacterium]|nr:hypothetical protein [Phycisphaerales bacterium]